MLLALWDGCPPEKQFGCGTVEVINFALGHKFLDGDHLFNPGILNDCAVLWLYARRSGGEKTARPQALAGGRARRREGCGGVRQLLRMRRYARIYGRNNSKNS